MAKKTALIFLLLGRDKRVWIFNASRKKHLVALLTFFRIKIRFRRNVNIPPILKRFNLPYMAFATHIWTLCIHTYIL